MPKVRHICRTGSGIKEPQFKRESWPVIRQLALIMSAKSKGFNTVRITISTHIHSPKCWFTQSQLIESNFLKRYPGDKCVILSSYQSILIELCVKLKSGHLMRMLFDFEIPADVKWGDIGLNFSLDD